MPPGPAFCRGPEPRASHWLPWSNSLPRRPCHDHPRFDPGAPYDVEETTSPARPRRPAGPRLPAARRGDPRPLAAIVDVPGRSVGPRGSHGPGAIHVAPSPPSVCMVVSAGVPPGPRASRPRGQRRRGGGRPLGPAPAPGRLDVDARRIALLWAAPAAVRWPWRWGSGPGSPEHSGTPQFQPDGAPGLAHGQKHGGVHPRPVSRGRSAGALPLRPGPRARAAPTLGFDAKRLIASHRAYFADEAAMAAASATRIVAEGRAAAMPPVWLAQPRAGQQRALGDHRGLPRPYRARADALGRASCGSRHGFIRQAGPDAGQVVGGDTPVRRPASDRPLSRRAVASRAG